MFPDPVPHDKPVPYAPVAWPQGVFTVLKPRSEPLAVDMVSLLERRQTRREFSGTVSEAVLGEFLWLACRSRSSRLSPYGVDQESRSHPSAGAMHPIHVLVGMAAEMPWQRYDAQRHAFTELPGSETNASAVRKSADQLVRIDKGVVLALVAEPGKTASKYREAASLVWRDGGVVLGYMSVIAEALGLSFCPLGITGNPFLSEIPQVGVGLHGAGIAILGR